MRSAPKKPIQWELNLLAFPALILVFIFAYVPMFGVVMAFQDYDYQLGFFGSPFVGFTNFEFLFTTGAIWKVTANTLFLNAVFILAGMAGSVVLALLMYELTNKKAIKTYQTILVFPNFMSWIIAAYMFYTFLNPRYGMLNQALTGLGLEPVKWYSDPSVWPVILTVTSLWKGVGMGSLLYYAVLMGIERDYFEAAAIDGATKWQTIKKITLPFLIPTMTILLILSVGGIVRADFGLFYFMPQDSKALYPVTDVIDTYVFRALRNMNEPGMAAAAGFLQSTVGFFLVLGANAFVRKIAPENSLF